ncbi:MAG: hypothetical protein RR586_02735, partial [Cellulosilyticaceae bacterium]
LNELIKEANRKDDDDYTKTSWREFKKQLDKAEKVSKDKKATQEQIDKAIEELNKAIKELVEKRK